MTKPVANETLLRQLNWRYATKRFDAARKIDDADWKTLEQTLVLTPSSFGLQPWKFLVVQDAALRKQLRTASWDQSQVEEASHYVVILGRRGVDQAYVKSFVERTAEVRGIPVETLAKYEEVMVGAVVKGKDAATAAEWAARQDYIALGSLMTCAAVLGIDACPMEGLDPQRYDQILGLDGTEFRTVVACALGYRHADDKYQSVPKVRFPTADMVEYR